MATKKNLSFLEDDIQKRVDKSRIKLPEKKKKTVAKNSVYFWLGAIIIISVLAGLLNTLYRLF
ncbi:hypothetical protein ACVRZD_07845 [Streptococcus hongkongensis]|nr:hypothetical protein NC01_07610 [Streptococcus uberis]